MKKDLSQHKQDILLALHSGDLLHHAGGITYLVQNRHIRVQYLTGNSLVKDGLIEVDTHPYHRLSPAGEAIVLDILKGEAA